MAVFLQPTTVRDRPTMVMTTSVGVLSYTSHPSLRGVPSVSGISPPLAQCTLPCRS